MYVEVVDPLVLDCRGLLPSVVAILPEAAITYGLFDLLKRNIARWSGRTEAGVVPSLTAGAMAAFMGQVVAYPLETISRCMQVCHKPRNLAAFCIYLESRMQMDLLLSHCSYQKLEHCVILANRASSASEAR
jgi:hypothetical protein